MDSGPARVEVAEGAIPGARRGQRMGSLNVSTPLKVRTFAPS